MWRKTDDGFVAAERQIIFYAFDLHQTRNALRRGPPEQSQRHHTFAQISEMGFDELFALGLGHIGETRIDIESRRARLAGPMNDAAQGAAYGADHRKREKMD